MISHHVVPAALDNNSVVVIAPGPAISGMANGKTAISETCSAIVLSVSRASRCGRSPKTIW
jgi:hypothetical protein